MQNRKSSKVLKAARYLFPKNGRWLIRTLLLFAFILFDYTITLAFCSDPVQEGNPFARQFMEIYGIFLGLTIYDFINNLPIYMVLCVVSYTVDLPQRPSRIIEPCIDIVFAWFVDGAHFDGAASWFWPNVDSVERQTVGFGLYLIFALILFVKSKKSLNISMFKFQTKLAGPAF